MKKIISKFQKKKSQFFLIPLHLPITMTMMTRRQQKMHNIHNAFTQGVQTRQQTVGKQRYAIADYKQPSGIREPRRSRVSATTVGSARATLTNSRQDRRAVNNLPSHYRPESSSGSPDFSSSTCKKVFPKGTIDLATIDSNLDCMGKASMMVRYLAQQAEARTPSDSCWELEYLGQYNQHFGAVARHEHRVQGDRMDEADLEAAHILLFFAHRPSMC
jgi:hypothetical protein